MSAQQRSKEVQQALDGIFDPGEPAAIVIIADYPQDDGKIRVSIAGSPLEVACLVEQGSAMVIELLKQARKNGHDHKV